MDVEPYFDFVRDHGSTPRDEFLRVFEGKLHLLFSDLTDLSSSNVFKTLRVRPGVTPPVVDTSLGIVSVEKDPQSNAFSLMITLGRAKNNDLVVPDRRISSCHAYFRWIGKRLMLTDSNSTNGTRVNGIQLTGERSVELRSTATVHFGVLAALALNAEDLWAQLQQDLGR
jgi:hypothetical protein